MTDTDAVIDTIARTAWGEARNQGARGMQAVINVILNRAAHPGWWGSDPVSVCRAPWQFSCWNFADPNRAALMAVCDRDPEFSTALILARQALAGNLVDITGGADSYYAAGTPVPDWTASAWFTRQIGAHIFYITRHVRQAPCGAPVDTADALNAAELTKIADGES